MTLRRYEVNNALVLHKDLEGGLLKLRLLEIFYRAWGKTRNHSWNNNTPRHRISRYKVSTHKEINTTTNRYKEEICKWTCSNCIRHNN